MDMILSNAADVTLIAATLGAGLFCLILSRRLTRLSRIDNGLGGAIAVLSAQVDDMSKALADTKSGSEGSAARLQELNAEAQTLLEELELMLSACHDLGEAPAPETESAPQIGHATAGSETDWNVFDDLLTDGDDDDRTWQETAAQVATKSRPVIRFGSRRQTDGQPAESTIPPFLKSKSVLAGLG